jgi:hypothetical protein
MYWFVIEIHVLSTDRSFTSQRLAFNAHNPHVYFHVLGQTKRNVDSEAETEEEGESSEESDSEMDSALEPCRLTRMPLFVTLDCIIATYAGQWAVTRLNHCCMQWAVTPP